MNTLQQIWYWLKARQQPSGLLPLKKDDRDLKIEAVLGGWFGTYKPLYKSRRLTPTFTKHQRNRSNCSFQSGSNVLAIALVIQSQIGEEISARYITAKAYQQGLCGVHGWADIRSFLKVAQKFGCCSEAECPSEEYLSWNQYVNIDFSKLDKLAKNRKIGSYYKINNIGDYYRAIDAGHGVALGRNWLSGMNQGGGFSHPWILPRTGYSVGGHATCGVGYDTNYKNIEVSDELNSYGKEWGDNGYFYCPTKDLARDIAQYGAYAITDVIYTPKMTTERIIAEYNGKNIRGDKNGAIYLIYDGKKMAYRDAEAFVAVNGYPYTAKGAFIMVPQQAIDGVPAFGDGSPLTGDLGKFKDIVDMLKKPINNNFKDNIEVNQ